VKNPFVIIFTTANDDKETYKVHQETFLKEGLQCYVCNDIKN